MNWSARPATELIVGNLARVDRKANNLRIFFTDARRLHTLAAWWRCVGFPRAEKPLVVFVPKRTPLARSTDPPAYALARGQLCVHYGG
jgi:hypothetical protein